MNKFKEVFLKRKGRVNDLVLKEKFKKSDQWYKYDINGEPCKFTIIHIKNGDRESFAWTEIEKLAVKLYSKKYATSSLKHGIPSTKEVAHSTFGRTFRKLLIGELNTAYNYKLDTSDLPFKLRIKRFTTNKYIKKVLDLGHVVKYKSLPTDSDEEVEMTKKILNFLDVSFFL